MISYYFTVFRFTGSTSTASSQYSNFSTSGKLKDTSATSNASHYERYVYMQRKKKQFDFSLLLICLLTQY